MYFVRVCMVSALEFCRWWDENVYVGVVGNVLLGVFEGSIHPLSWTSWHRTLHDEMQCWALNVVANCKTAPQDIRWDSLGTDHFLWWHVTLTFSHEITTCAEKLRLWEMFTNDDYQSSVNLNTFTQLLIHYKPKLIYFKANKPNGWSHPCRNLNTIRYKPD